MRTAYNPLLEELGLTRHNISQVPKEVRLYQLPDGQYANLTTADLPYYQLMKWILMHEDALWPLSCPERD